MEDIRYDYYEHLIEPHTCQWDEVYYGIKCRFCGLMYPDGTAPWEEFFEDGLAEGVRDEPCSRAYFSGHCCRSGTVWCV